eukprot:7379597-Prymnesium_polylepis.1
MVLLRPSACSASCMTAAEAPRALGRPASASYQHDRERTGVRRFRRHQRASLFVDERTPISSTCTGRHARPAGTFGCSPGCVETACGDRVHSGRTSMAYSPAWRANATL